MERWKRIAARAGWFGAGMVAAAVAMYVLAARAGPDDEPWHRWTPQHEFRHGARGAPADFAGYLALEERVFDDVRRFVDGAAHDTNRLGRYNGDSPTCPLAFEPNWNRTFVIDTPAPRGGALLLHGLSDSPYSLLPVGRLLAARGYRVVGLRLPGHGTVPAALRQVDWLDWRDAVRLAATDLRRAIGPDTPLVLVGYSNGAALALEHTLAAVADPGVPRPDALIFLSPALSVSRLAALARWQLLASRIPGLHRLSWNSMLPEYDPYKYNSFALNAGYQIHRLTTRVETGLAALEDAGRLDALPPALSFQSVADATIPPLPSLRRLYRRVTGTGNEVVLFDVNRLALIGMFLARDTEDLKTLVATGGPFGFDVTLVTNIDDQTAEVAARTRDAGRDDWREEPLGLAWPPGIYSLSHLAVPFPPDDPIYGSVTAKRGPYPFGRLEARGERGGLTVPVELLMRLRFNPFFPYVERRLATFLDGVEGRRPVSEPEQQGHAQHQPVPGERDERVARDPVQ